MREMVEVNFHIDELMIITRWYNLLFGSGKPPRIKFEPKDEEKQLVQKACFMARQMAEKQKERCDFFSDDKE